MAIVLRVAFPAGRYHATPWGRHVNEGVSEWPPSPWRLLRALIAVWKRTCPGISADQVLRALLPLVEPPRFHLPPHRVAHTRHYMPWEKKGPLDRTLIFDTFVSVTRNEPLWIGWPDAQLDGDAERCLSSLVENVSCLGRAETVVEMSLANAHASGSMNWNCVPSNDNDPNPIDVLCPDPATCFASEHYPRLDPAKLAKGKVKPADYLFDCPPWHACIDTETIHARRWPTVPGARWVNYSRPSEVLSPKFPTAEISASSSRSTEYPRQVEAVSETPPRPSIAPTPSRHERPMVARFVLDGPVLPRMTDTVAVAEAVRRAAMSCFRRWCERHPTEADVYRRRDEPERFASSIFSGRDSTGAWLPGPGHAHYWPTALDGDPRHVGGVTVFARDGFDRGEVAALAALRWLKAIALSELRIQLVGLGGIDTLGVEWTWPAAVWRSVTPFLGHSSIGARGQSRYLRKGLRREWRRLTEQHAPYAGVELLEVTELVDDDQSPSSDIQPRLFRRSREKHGGRESYRPAARYRLTFSQPIVGPLSLGYANHFGMGRFIPER